ncbi:MAG: hypothetical protein QM205_03325 [Bacillota bacterium]|jgi:hypothetical protein|nr:hypothetical protein [Bacillota bacterium]
MVIPSAFIIPIALFMMFGAAILYKDKPNTQKKVRFIAFLLYFVPFALGILYQVGDIVAYKVRYTFSVEKWAAADQNERGRLINSFRTNHPLVGENISVAKALLGEPDVSGDTYFIYYIGDYDKWLAMDPYYYSITFNSENIITAEDINQS